MKLQPLFNTIDKHCYQPNQRVSVDKSIVPYFDKHGAKQYIYRKAITFGFKLWVMANPLVIVSNFDHTLVKIQFCRGMNT